MDTSKNLTQNLATLAFWKNEKEINGKLKQNRTQNGCGFYLAGRENGIFRKTIQL